MPFGTGAVKKKTAGKTAAPPEKTPGKYPWAGVFRALEKWREDLRRQAAAGEGDPSVTTVAERYRRDPWAVLVSTILSLRTKDEVTLAASRRFLEKAGDPKTLLSLPVEEAARLAYPAGFYRTKAANLMKIAAILEEQHGGQVPSDMETLLGLPGVGRKTANLVRIEAFDLPGICVDIHVHRISNRTGWVTTRAPEETEMALRNALPPKYWKPINALLVLYGQNVCRPLSPYCSRCVITRFCRRTGVGKSR
jgi:endonuclease-3